MLARVPDRYPISTLDSDEHDVLLTVGEVEMVGRVRFTNTGLPRYQIREGKRLVDMPRKASAQLWRPVDVNTWPYELPEPAWLTREQNKPVPALQMVPSGDYEDDGDIPSGVYLGRPHEPPACVSEVKVRLIRCMRTRTVMEKDVRRVEKLWPQPWLDEATIKQKQLEAQKRRRKDIEPVMFGWRESDYQDFYVDASGLNSLPARFKPTHRDVSDYEANIDQRWMAFIPAYDKWIFKARAEVPPAQWFQIADTEKVDEHVIVERYGKALERIFKRVGR
jgi:hypothetical protein